MRARTASMAALQIELSKSFKGTPCRDSVRLKLIFTIISFDVEHLTLESETIRISNWNETEQKTIQIHFSPIIFHFMRIHHVSRNNYSAQFCWLMSSGSAKVMPITLRFSTECTPPLSEFEAVEITACALCMLNVAFVFIVVTLRWLRTEVILFA